MAWRVAKSLLKLRTQINNQWPNRNKASDGTIGDPAHKAEGTGSDHNPNKDGVVMALDITHDPKNGLDIDKLSDELAASHDPRIKYMIANGMALEPRLTGWNWVQYTGTDPHTSHLHISVYGDYDNEADWRIGGNEVITDRAHLDLIFQRFEERNSTKEEQEYWIGKRGYEELLDVLIKQKGYFEAVKRQELGRAAQEGDWEKRLLAFEEAAKKGAAPKPLAPGTYVVK